MFVHLTLVPYIAHAGELKTKPTQHSVNELRRIGIQPDMLICRSEEPLPDEMREKIALFTSVRTDSVISGQNVRDIYEVPLVYRAQGVDDQILKHFHLETGPPNLTEWESLVERAQAAAQAEPVRIALVGKYMGLQDAYLSVTEALRHVGHPARPQARGRLAQQRDSHRVRARGAPARRPRRADPGRFRNSRRRGQDRRFAHRPRAGHSVSRASASECRWPSSISRATSPVSKAPTALSSTPRPRTR